MRTLTASVALFAAALVPVQCRAQAATPPSDIAETVLAGSNFKILSKALDATGLLETLKGKGPFTLFAPTDDAFTKMTNGAPDQLLGKPDELKQILMRHVVAGRHTSDELKTMTTVNSMGGAALPIHPGSKNIQIGKAAIINPDIECTNGVIQVIDAVLSPH